jgi:hypothetical protein
MEFSCELEYRIGAVHKGVRNHYNCPYIEDVLRVSSAY